MTHFQKKNPVALSIGMMAWNEEGSIRDTLESLFRQSIFERLHARHEMCEILVLADGCTDGTAQVAREFFEQMDREHSWGGGCSARVIELPGPAGNDAWNRFVHEFSAVDARFIALMDSRIAFHHRDTLYNLMAALERRPHASASSDRACKDLLFKERKTVGERLSLATSFMAAKPDGQVTGQLYCMRTKTARNLYLPRDLGGSAGIFFQQAICTDFFSHDPDPSRIVAAPNAAHIYPARLTLQETLDREQRQMAGQTGVHVLFQYVATLSFEDRQNLADTLRREELRDPDWLKKLIARHLRARPFFWQLFPGVLTFRFRRCFQLPGLSKVTNFPAACAGFVLTMMGCARARRALRRATRQPGLEPARQPTLSVPQGAK